MKSNLKDLIRRVLELERKREMSSLMSDAKQNHLYLRATFCDSDEERLEAYDLLDKAVVEGRILEGEWLHRFLKEINCCFDELSGEQRETIENMSLRELLRALFGTGGERS